ncbi:bifunctional 4-hydroxy-2-oxoglutarate aldolase/2-dehydro-3-deoxy-phosphogluconate aldolase [Sphingomonas sp.]|uniref:bifunctional 4-hydroxy-2-oxoglutarate aldolase/2-dehydro-3-deoxy-phosphogluconate aldolase n=1 Tax=Sphingomonas sp. TaxID=28214 RepID=UPI00286A764C|nr:bifunctional 4-hydroxy-2-oxoglutarate aldolase/2-dehydro-3-deoxy-phosphogluconate aldolase [Sphingomonas sp.]
MNIDAIMRLSPVIPVLVIDEDGPDPVELAETLVANGLRVIEVTLRTPGALAAMTAMAGVSGAVVGAGTILDPDQLLRAIDAGAKFIVSPGLTERIGRAAIDSGVAYLPGVANSGDIMRGMEMGLDRFKFFPAMASGGLPALKALCGPFYDARFCPTGGITRGTAPEWLADPAVLCVGGSWVVPKGEWSMAKIGVLAKTAAQLR